MMRCLRMFGSVTLLLVLNGCLSLPTQLVPIVATATVTPSVTPVPTSTATPIAVVPTAVMPRGTAQNPLRIRIIQSDLNSSEILQKIIEQSAQEEGISVQVDIHSADGAYALADTQDPAVAVDGWIGTDYDVAQLAQQNAIATDVVSSSPMMYPFVQDSLANHAQYAVYPIAAKNYLIGIANADLLPELPLSTADMMTIDRRTQGRSRYDMAFAWAEGRWFDPLVAALDPAATVTSPVQPPRADALQQALTSLTEIRTLGPREATSYQEAVTDFVNWRVQYTLDGDAALRRYEQYSQTLTLAFAPPPLYSITETPINPPVDVVSLIAAPSSDTTTLQALQTLRTTLQGSTTQGAFVTQLYWVPIAPQTYTQIDITNNPTSGILRTIAPTFRAQSYSAATLCRWDAYEAVLPFVLLREQSIAAGVDALSTALQDCLAP